MFKRSVVISLSLLLASFQVSSAIAEQAPSPVTVVGESTMTLDRGAVDLGWRDFQEGNRVSLKNDEFTLTFFSGRMEVKGSEIVLTASGDLEVRSLDVDLKFKKLEGKKAKRATSDGILKFDVLIKNDVADSENPVFHIKLKKPVIIQAGLNPLVFEKDGSGEWKLKISEEAQKLIYDNWQTKFHPLGKMERFDANFTVSYEAKLGNSNPGEMEKLIEANKIEFVDQTLGHTQIYYTKKSNVLEKAFAKVLDTLPAHVLADAKQVFVIPQPNAKTPLFAVSTHSSVNPEISKEWNLYQADKFTSKEATFVSGAAASQSIRHFLAIRRDNGKRKAAEPAKYKDLLGLPDGYQLSDDGATLTLALLPEEQGDATAFFKSATPVQSLVINLSELKVAFPVITTDKGARRFIDVILPTTANEIANKPVAGRIEINATGAFASLGAFESPNGSPQMPKVRFFGDHLKGLVAFALLPTAGKEQLGQPKGPAFQFLEVGEGKADSFESTISEAKFLEIRN